MRSPLAVSCLCLSVLTAGAVKAQRLEPLASADGLEQAAVLDGVASIAGSPAKLFTYDSPRGHLEVEVSAGRLSIGSFSMELTRKGPAENQAYILTVVSGGETAFTELSFDPGESDRPGEATAHVNESEAVSRLLQAFAASLDGQMLADAKGFITRRFGVSETMLRDMSLARAARHSKMQARTRSPLDFFSWACLGAVLNQVAAGAAMIGGCGTPACGPYYVWCCTSGVAWYSSAFIMTMLSCG
jgi:hypothetical protein